MSNPPKATSLAELRRRAAVDKTDTTKYAMRRWVTSVNRLYEEGDNALRFGDLEKAFVHYMKGCSIMLEVINRHPEYSSTQKDPFYVQLRKRTNDEIMTILEDIGEKIQFQYDKQSYQQASATDTTDGDPDVQRALDKYPPISSPVLSTLDSLPPVPAHIPSSVMNTAMPRKASGDTTASASSKYNHVTSPSDSASSNTTKSSSTKDSKTPNQTSTGIPLPARSNNVFPKTPQVEPRELARWITRKDNPASILLLDVRPRDLFHQACIKHKWMVQIEPLVLRKDVSSHKIQDSLVLNPPAEQQLFEQRNMFDLVVLYDQNSPTATQMNLPLKYLKDAIYELEFTKYLDHAPMMLVGGFDAWIASIGARGVYSFGDSEHFTQDTVIRSIQGQATNAHGPSKNSAIYNEKTEIPPVNHNIYDYFNHKQRSGNLQSMSRSNQNPQYQYQHQQPSLQHSHQYQYGMPMPMPMPMPNNDYTANADSAYDADVAKFSSRYPDIQPNKSAATNSALQRHNTFIDNPFHGFTATSNKMYDFPPTPAKPTRPLPPPPSTTNVSYDLSPPHRPSSAGPTAASTTSRPSIPPKIPIMPSLNNPHASIDTNSRVAPVSDSSFSQLGGVLIGTTGLKNLGNTCYMNSIIQCLSGTIPFARYFISGMFKQHINKQNPLGTGGILAERFAELLRVMWSENYNFISPVTFREALVRFAPQYSGTEQQDSQEFLNFLLDGIHEDLNAIRQKPTPMFPDDPTEEARLEQLPDHQASSLAWEKYMSRNASVIVSLFQGQYRSRLTCLSCKTTSTTYNTFMSLSLPIPSKRSKLSSSGVTLYQCLDYFVKEEVLEKAEAWRCPKCQKLRKASKALTLSRLPDVLLIHLKRFSFDGPFRNKLETNVNFPTKNLDLTRYVPNTMTPQNTTPQVLNYDLYAVSNHYGSLTGGHYTACVRNSYRGEWHNFDDTRFSVCDESKVKSHAAYNLFYVRSTVK